MLVPLLYNLKISFQNSLRCDNYFQETHIQVHYRQHYIVSQLQQ
jgi:hypothetical protein